MTIELVESWRFRCGPLGGYISGGHEHGVELTCGADGKPVTRPMCLNLEHYYAAGRLGWFVPRYEAAVAFERTAQDTVRVVIEPCGEWRVRSTITYRALPDGTIAVAYDFCFGAAYPEFEALVSNYFHQPDEPWVHVGGAWVRPRLGEREHRYWARGPGEAAMMQDGRLQGALARIKGEYAIVVDPAFYDYPVLVSPIGESGWSLVHLIEPSACASLSANRTWNAHDFSLVGRDVCQGETVECRARMIYAKLQSLDEALRLYEAFLGDSPRKPGG